MGGAANAKLGAVMGAVMKAHKGEVEPALVKSVAERLLG
jgi:Asp-tRNA(Asn)/Glu-tRNA(Gln) amidotransferase B subunit